MSNSQALLKISHGVTPSPLGQFHNSGVIEFGGIWLSLFALASKCITVFATRLLVGSLKRSGISNLFGMRQNWPQRAAMCKGVSPDASETVTVALVKNCDGT